MQKSKLIPEGKTIIDLNACHTHLDNRGSHCGYCQGQKPYPGHAQWGITSTKMSVVDYQKLMDRGWRRCGTYYYKFDFENSCCQPYTIRLDTQEYQISASQKKVMKRFNKFLLGEIDMEGKSTLNNEEVKAGEKMLVDQNQKIANKDEEDSFKKASILEALTIICSQVLKVENVTKQVLEQIVNTSIMSNSRDKTLKDSKSWSSNCLIKLFFSLKDGKQIEENLRNSGIKGFTEFLRSPQNLEQINKQGPFHTEIRIEDSGYLTFINPEKCEVQQEKTIKQKKIAKDNGKVEEEKKGTNLLGEELNYTQYFKEFAPLSKDQLLKPLKHKYTVQITKAIANEASFSIYQKYQEKIHHEPEKGMGGYSRFLCQNPLFDPQDQKEASKEPTKRGDLDADRVQKDEGVWPEYLGGYHMIHRIDGEIMAVGVLDFTPNVLSSVYLYYNPKFEFLSPGTFAAVREIEYQLKIQEFFNPEFKYYYMGLYFQDCQKSVYKGTYKPSQVLCPHTQNYVYLTDEVREKISKEIMPKLCEDKPKIKELNLSEKQAQTLVTNFQFLLSNSGKMIKIENLNPKYAAMFRDIVTQLFFNLGLDVMLSAFFTV